MSDPRRAKLPLTIKQAQLDNGLRIVVVPFNLSQSTDIFVYGYGGSLYDPPDREGTHHAVEHVALRAIRGAPTIESINKKLARWRRDDESSGAATSPDQVMIYLSVPALPTTELEEGIKVCANAALHPAIYWRKRNTGWFVEKETIINEMLDYRDTPEYAVEEAVDQLIWRSHPMGRSILGDRSSLKKVKYSDFVTAYSNTFHPRNMLLVVIGRTTLATVLTYAKRYFKTKRAFEPRPTLKAPVLSVDLPLEERLIVVGNGKFKKMDMARLSGGFKTYGRRDPFYHALWILEYLLGNRWGSKMYVELRELKGLMYHKHPLSLEHLRRMGLIRVETSTRARKMARWVRLALEILAKARTEPPTKEQLQLAQRSIKAYLRGVMDSPGELAEWIFDEWVDADRGKIPEDFTMKTLRKVLSVTPEDVLQAAQRRIVGNRLCLAVTENVPVKDLAEIHRAMRDFEETAPFPSRENVT